MTNFYRRNAERIMDEVSNHFMGLHDSIALAQVQALLAIAYALEEVARAKDTYTAPVQ